MNYEIFSKTIENGDHKRVCRFCLTENAYRRIEAKTIGQLYKQITNDNLFFSPDYPTFICSKCETNLRTAVKIRNDITKIERCWKKYISEMHLMTEIKIEEVDDESVNFETVEMVIEPVNQMYLSSGNFDEEVDYLDMDSKREYAKQYESYGNDAGSIDNYESIDSDDNLENITSITKITSITEVNECEHCDTGGLSKAELKLHLQSCHPEISNTSQFVCDICHARYSSRYGIRTHMKRHMQGSTESAGSKSIKRYQCSSCDERFSKKTLLVEHELRHSGAAIHVCHICGIGKKTKSLMSSHLITHNPDYILKKKLSAKPKNSKRYFTCWSCPTRVDFQSLDELKIHRKNLHHDFQCKFCKNGFMTNEALQSHMLIHGTQERPHLCKFCGGTFSKIGHLKSHIQGKHAKHKPYPCQKCPKGFVHRYQLQAHIRISHDKIKAFQCTECPTSFGHAKSRVWHMRTVHKM